MLALGEEISRAPSFPYRVHGMTYRVEPVSLSAHKRIA